jgi:hypothetical protein
MLLVGRCTLGSVPFGPVCAVLVAAFPSIDRLRSLAGSLGFVAESLGGGLPCGAS